jgi:hypothetical protein
MVSCRMGILCSPFDTIWCSFYFEKVQIMTQDEAHVRLARCRQRVEELRIKLSKVQGDLSRAITEEKEAMHAYLQYK